MTGRSIPVTSGAGYIGSHACKALAMAGYEPVTYDNLVSGNRWAIRWGPLEFGDILDPSRLAEVCNKYRPIAIIHFAASALVGESMTAPALYYRNNVMDNAPQRPVNPYGTSKLMVERMLADYDNAYGTRYAALGYFNAAGADPDGEIGESRTVETHLIPLMLDAILGKRLPLRVLGTDYPTPDGTAIRDYVHVADLATAHIKALEHLLEKQTSFSCNLGSSVGYSVREVMAAARTVTGRDMPHTLGPRRPGDPPMLVAQPQRAAELLGLTMPHSVDIHRIVADAWSWHMRGLTMGFAA